jgi:hypothetical protein
MAAELEVDFWNQEADEILAEMDMWDEQIETPELPGVKPQGIMGQRLKTLKKEVEDKEYPVAEEPVSNAMKPRDPSLQSDYPVEEKPEPLWKSVKVGRQHRASRNLPPQSQTQGLIETHAGRQLASIWPGRDTPTLAELSRERGEVNIDEYLYEIDRALGAPGGNGRRASGLLAQEQGDVDDYRAQKHLGLLAPDPYPYGYTGQSQQQGTAMTARDYRNG